MRDDEIMSSGVTRRTFLAGVGGAVALSVAGGTASAAATKEAPQLAALVKDGKLPPLAERLPKNPMVVKPWEKIGTYGGTLRRGLRGSSDHNGILRMVGNQGLVRWNMDFTETLPNLAERWDVNADASQFTFYLLKGVKWSDGHPFTADDVVFAIEDVVKNKDLYSSTPAQISVAGKPVVVEKIDDYTVKFTFAAANALYLENLATPLGQHPTLFAKHYCSKYLPKYNPNLDADVKAAGSSSWPDLFRAKCGDIEIPQRWGNAEKPVLDPWMIKEAYSGGATRVLMVRNPYFWQVDTEGNQLPYVDELNFGISQDVESLMLNVISGKIDIQERHINSLANKPTLSQNMKKGDYRLLSLVPSAAQQCSLYLNMTHKDPVLRKIFADKSVRQALSMGINRQEIIDIVYFGQSEGYQTGPRPGHPWYHEKLARQFTEFATDKANAMLDKAGLDKKNANGIRLRPDGQPLFFAVDVIPTLYPDLVDVLELVKAHWAKIGVSMKVNTIERALYYTRGDDNAHDAQVWPGPGGLDPMLDPRDFFAFHPQGSRYAIPWTLWYTSNGAKGEEPPESQKKRFKLYDEARSTADVNKRGAIMKQLFDITAEEFEVMGICLAVGGFGVIRNNLRNVPEKQPDSWSWPNPGPALPQQFTFTS
ncbi:peptide/nickel transport system substrate-binding protein [Neorhizobium galegae]|uniref:ABC transporter substrate-binding protein n=1 Tax=Neorhizobium galegae TaxID=399 RepID=UPI001AE43E00|nr:ABC transporter substrate-binding protein [Neorhizobium galegae]MBP2561382.1 peptide/nickel transport system substrate-binding protein [Neorhizobium galegae]MDQ0134380.1 peptide/nickel transport system substrate-binding protein [Neorhizobium galegae]